LVEVPRGKFLSIDPYLQMEGDFIYEKKITTGRGRKRRVEIIQTQGRKYKRDYCLPWVAQFLQDLARDYAQEFPDGPSLKISSAIRPNDAQTDLSKRIGNRNVSSRSVHPTGAAIDIIWGREPKKRLDGSIIWQRDASNKIIRNEDGDPIAESEYEALPKPQKRWLEGRLILLKKNGVVEPEQEGNQPCYHIAVPKNYADLLKRKHAQLYY